jgi:anti-anti-sigma factor
MAYVKKKEMKRELIKMTLTEKGEGIAGVTLSGELTVRSAEEFKSKMLSLIDQYSILDLSVEGITAMDLSGVQIIEAFKKTIQQKGKRFTLVTVLPEELQLLLARAGVKEIFMQ